MSKFYEHMYREQEIICAKLGIKKKMLPLTDEQNAAFDKASSCPHCRKQFDKISCDKAKHQNSGPTGFQMEPGGAKICYILYSL